MCTHKNGVRFLACYCADRWPGVYVCIDCGEKINGKEAATVRVELHPNAPKQSGLDEFGIVPTITVRL